MVAGEVDAGGWGDGAGQHMRRHSGRMAMTESDFEKMWESTMMRRAIYPKFITKKLFVVVPLWCLVVQDEREESGKEGCHVEG